MYYYDLKSAELTVIGEEAAYEVRPLIHLNTNSVDDMDDCSILRSLPMGILSYSEEEKQMDHTMQMFNCVRLVNQRGSIISSLFIPVTMASRWFVSEDYRPNHRKSS